MRLAVDTDAIMAAFAHVPPAVLLKYGLAGAALGAVLTPLLVFLAIKYNHERLGDLYAAYPQTPAFYGLFARAGAALVGLIGASQPVLDAAGENEIYIRGALIAIIMVFIGVPFVRALKGLRRGP